MTFEKLNEIFTADFNLDKIVAAQQSWHNGARFSRLERPRSSHGLFLLTDHAVYEFTDGATMQAAPGDLLLLPKGARYVTIFSAPVQKETHPLMINFRLTDIEGNEVYLGDRVIRLCHDSGEKRGMFMSAIQLYVNTAPAKLKSQVFALFGALFPIADADECCIGYIGRHYTDDLSIPDLAQRCAVSETVYRKRFKQLTGQSPVRYINKLKIDKACEMLQSGDIPPRQISDFLNFYSLPYFYKVFKEHMGVTPNQYRDQLGE